MNDLQLLEYPRVLSLVAGQCHSQPAAEKILGLQPLNELVAIKHRQELCREAIGFVQEAGGWNLHDLADLEPLFTEPPVYCYNFDEFKLFHQVLRTVDNALEKMPETELYPELHRLWSRATRLDYLEKRFSEIFSPEGDVLDSASTTLASIRTRLRGLRRQIGRTLQNFLQQPEQEKFLQDKLVTQRDNRYVIPLKAGSENFVPGVVHARSGSGASVFVEPLAVVGMNNELAGLEGEEKEEIHRILVDYTAALNQSRELILANVRAATKADFYQAVAIWARYVQAYLPEVIPDPLIELKNARHPLLINKLGIAKTVPFKLELGGEYKLLIISGPNTGGKTATLKAVGLNTALALTGLPIPADPASRIGLFTSIFTDIGDSQSLEDSLSTFSSHIMRLKRLVETGDEKTLALVDEIGSATDPEQGSALAQAIVEAVVQAGVTGLFTTHYTSLKVMAESHPLCRNASLQFDPVSHSPTYQVVFGMPGQSFALETAARLGLPEMVMVRARELAGDESISLTEVLTRLTQEKKETAKLNYQLNLKTRLLEFKEKEYEEKLAKADELAKQARKQAQEEARTYLAQMQAELNSEMDEFRRAEKSDKKNQAQKVLRAAGDHFNKLSGWDADEDKLDPDNLKPGQRVRIGGLGAEGVVTEVGRDTVKVNSGGIVYTTAKGNLLPTREKPPRVEKSTPKTEAAPPAEKPGMNFEVKLLGLTFDEAQPKLDEFLDNAYTAGFGRVRIVHGKGTGALRAKVRNYLKMHREVEDFYSPAPEAGGEGVTIAVLRSNG